MHAPIHWKDGKNITKSLPRGLNLQMAWGPVEVQPKIFIIVRDDDVRALGRIALALLGIPLNPELERIPRSMFERPATPIGRMRAA